MIVNSDMVIAAENAEIALSEVKHGVIALTFQDGSYISYIQSM